MGHPWRTALPVVAVLVGLGLPFTGVSLGAPDASILPPTVQSRAGFDTLRTHWGEGEVSPAILVFQTRDGGPALRSDRVAALYDFLQRVQADSRVERVERVNSLVTLDSRLTRAQYALLYGEQPAAQSTDVYAQAAAHQTVRGDTVVARVVSRFGQTDDRSKQLVRAIRGTPPPDGFTLLVGGGTAGVLHYVDTLYQEFPEAAAVVVVALYGLLSIAFRSAALPLKALLVNTLSILASNGALVVVIQDGAPSRVLRFAPLGFVEASLPMVLFGLSMDHEVFLLSRIKEAHESGCDNATSVAIGLQRSGRIITSAAGIVVLVSLSFVAADIVLIKALGLG
jgi:putative drug exporter of the RND superfamily